LVRVAGDEIPKALGERDQLAKSLDSKLKEVQVMLNSLLEEVHETGNGSPSHWELPILPPPDPDGRLSSTDLLNWWFRAPQSRSGAWDEYFKPLGEDGPQPAPAARNDPPNGGPEPAHDVWAEISILFPEPEEHLAEEHAQAAVDCLYDFLHAVGQRDVEAAAALIDDLYHTIEGGEEVDKLKFKNRLHAQVEALRDLDFEVSLAVAPEPVNHPYGVLIHAQIQFDMANPLDGAKSGRVEHRVAILRQDGSGAWKIAALPRVAR
jgi:hypothetical protein